MQVPCTANLGAGGLAPLLHCHIVKQDVVEDHGSLDETTNRRQRLLDVGQRLAERIFRGHVALVHSHRGAFGREPVNEAAGF